MNTIKTTLETVTTAFFYFTGITWLYTKICSLHGRNIPIIFYHEITDDEKHGLTEFSVNTVNFEKQISWLCKHYTIVSVDQLTQYIGTGQSHSKRLAAISFDGGYVGNYLYAYPILKKYKTPVTIYIITNAIDGDLSKERKLLYLLSLSEKNSLCLMMNNDEYEFDISDFANRVMAKKNIQKYMSGLSDIEQDNLLQELAKNLDVNLAGIAQRLFLSWEQIKEMSQDSLIDIGSHTLTHSRLTDIDAQQAKREIIESKVHIEMKLGKDIRSFCYPDGYFSTETKALVEEAGYTSALAVSTPGIWSDLNKDKDDVYQLRRMLMMNRAYVPLLSAELSGLTRILKKLIK